MIKTNAFYASKHGDHFQNLLARTCFFHWFNNNEWERIQELNLDYMAKKDMTEMIEGVNIL